MLLEFKYKLKTFIKDYKARQAIEFLDIYNIKLSNLFSIISIIIGYKIIYLYKSIYYNKDSVTFLTS